VKIVTGNDFKPFSDEGLPNGGLGGFLISEVYRSLGDHVVIDFKPWKRGLREALSGKYIGTFPYRRTSARERDFIYSDSFFDLNSKLFVMKKSAHQALVPDDLNNMVLCNPLGYADGDVLGALLEQGRLKKITAVSLTNCFRLLEIGRVDMVRASEIAGLAAARGMGFTKSHVRVMDILIEQVSLHLIVSKSIVNAPSIIEHFNRGLTALKTSGKYDELVQGYLYSLEKSR
jgi:polar amino acid transport system substrate-binding protein